MTPFTIEEIKKLRAGITPGEWVWKDGDLIAKDRNLVLMRNDLTGIRFYSDKDKTFVAASPAIVDQLLEENERLRLCAISDWNGNIILQRDAEIERLKDINSQLSAQVTGMHLGQTDCLDRFYVPKKKFVELESQLAEMTLRARVAEDLLVERLVDVGYQSDAKEAAKMEIDKRVAELKGEGG